MKGKFYSFSPCGEKLSQVGPDGMVRVWDTTTGALDHEYQPASHLTARPSCLHYSPQVDSDKKSKKCQGKGEGSVGSSVLALATLQGTVLVYSPEKRELLATLDHSQPQPVVDVAWLNPNVLYSLAADNTLIKWNIVTGEKLASVEVNGSSSLCILSPRNICTARSRIEHIYLKKNGGVKLKKTFTGHTSQVGQMVPLPTESDPARYFLSCSPDDRFVYAWDLKSEGEVPLASFMVGDQVTGVEAMELKNNTVTIAVTTLKGSLILFSQHLNGNTNNTVVKRTGQLQIQQEGGKGKKARLPILAAHFCRDREHSLIIAYGNSSMLKFERISAKEISGKKQLQRSAPVAAAQQSTLAQTVTPKVTRDTTVVGPGHLTIAQADAPRKRKQGDEDGTLALPMDERLNALVLDKPLGVPTTQPPRTDNQIHLLLQGLHSKDNRILQGVLSCGNEVLVTNTVRRLPTPAVVPLLRHLQTLFMGKGHKNAAYVTWVRLVLYHHMSHLSTLPDRQDLLRPFYSISANRVSSFMQLTELHARLDLSLTHVATKHQEAQQAQVEPSAMLIYREEDSEEEEEGKEEMEVPGGASESEDNWEELSDYGEVNGQSSSDLDQEDEEEEEDLHIPLSSNSKPSTSSSKRGLMEVSNKEDEEEEEESSEEVSNDDDDDESQSDMTVDANKSESD